MLEILTVIVVLLLLVLLGLQFKQPARAAQMLEQQHRAMLTDLHDGLNKQGDRLIAAQAAESERLRSAVSGELRATRDAIAALRTEMLAQMLEKLVDQGRADQKLIQESFNNASQHLRNSIETLSKTVDGRLEQIGGKVNERLDEGFKKTNETFVSVMTRLATIDEAQKKIDGLTTNMVSLQELLGDKRSRGAFGEVQLEGLVRNIMPPQSYEMQYTLPNGTRADCVLKLPEPTGMVAVDSKFPLENYHRMFDAASPAERLVAEKQFKADVKKHVDDIGGKYIIPDVTSDGAVMFIPAEAIYYDLLINQVGAVKVNTQDLIEYAFKEKKVIIVSPTSFFAYLQTVLQGLRALQIEESAKEIRKRVEQLGKHIASYDAYMQKLGNNLGTTVNMYNSAYKEFGKIEKDVLKVSGGEAKIEPMELDKPKFD